MVIFAGTVFDRTFGAHLDTGAAFNTVINMGGCGLAVYKLIDAARAGPDALTMALAFVIIHPDGN